LLVPQQLVAQDPWAVDSLKKILSSNAPDSTRMKAFIGLAGEYMFSAPEISIDFCKQSLTLAERSKHAEGTGEALGWLAYLYEQQGNADLALDYNRRALKIAVELSDLKSEAAIFNNIAAIYNNRGQIADAILTHYKALSIRYKANDTIGVATSYNNLALIYQSQGRIPDALDYFSKALKIFENIHDQEGVAVAKSNIGFIYKEQKEYENAKEYFFSSLNTYQKYNDKYGSRYALNAIGGLYEEQGNLDSALHYFVKALEVRTEIEDKQGIAYALKNIGHVYLRLGRKTDAQETLKKSLAEFESLKDKRGLAAVTNLLGTLTLEGGDIDASRKMLERSLTLSEELGYPVEIRNAAGNLQLLFRRQKQWREALMMNDLFIRMRDSVENDVNKKAALRTLARYEYEKKEALLKSEQEKKNVIARAELKKQKLIRNSIAGGLAAVGAFLIVVFRQRNRIAKEKRRSDELLLNILPEETAEELKRTGTAKAKSFDLVTVLFTDFKNFTQASEKLTPEQLVSEINFCYSEFDKIIQKHGIEKIKTIGDAYMCAGGLPVPNKTHASDVVRAGLEMQQFISENQRLRESKGLPFFELRVGIHTGPVVAGIVGIKKFAYDIWGDTVNTASRMESSGETGKVNISGATYELVREEFDFEYRGRIAAKNKGEIEMYFVKGIK
jgi:class 3 adenylate cyclase/tetratricopeptide (TPR) repeat protein